MGKAKRFEDPSFKTPGPGSYKLPYRGVEGPSFSVKLRKPVDNALIAKGITVKPDRSRQRPGPGSYDITYQD